MREYLDSILAFIGTTSLTDDEMASCTLAENDRDDLDIYDFLVGVLRARDEVSATVTRLGYYFMARGTDLSSVLDEPTQTPPMSNIFVGAGLDDE